MFLVITVGSVDTGEGFLHDRGDDFVLVNALCVLNLFKNVFSPVEEMILEGDLLLDEELNQIMYTLRRELFRMLR